MGLIVENMVAANLNRWSSQGRCTVRRITGWNNQAANVYIQLHERPFRTGTIANTATTRRKSLVATPGNGFSYEFVSGLPLNELSIMLSSAETNLVAVLAGGGLDMTVEVESDYPVRPTTTIAGNYTDGSDGVTPTGRDSLNVWTDAAANAANRLYRIDYTNGESNPSYLMVFAKSPVNGDKPVITFPAVAAGSSQSYFFGQAGVQVFSLTSAAVASYGCFIYQSSTPGVLTSTSPDALSYIRAIYDTQ